MSCKEELPRSLKSLTFDVKDSNGNNLLHRFVLNNCTTGNDGNYINAVLRSLYGVPVNERNSEGYTALHLAVREMSCLMVSKLLSCVPNIDANLKSLQGGKTALQLAAELRPSEEDVATIVQCLMRRGADSNARDNLGNTPLLASVEKKNLKTVKVLIECGVCLNRSNICGDTPLYIAMREGCFEIAKALIEGGADVNIRNRYRNTPLHVAVGKGCLEIAMALIEAGANVNIRNRYRNTPLHVAARKGYLEIAMALIEAGANLNIRNRYNDTPLHVTAREGCFKIHKALIEVGSDINIRNKELDTPLVQAIKGKYISKELRL